jgi:acylphosphatase
MTACQRFRVSGRVQGVGFRFAACAEARRLGITGWVRNLPNGDVEAFACGDADQLLVLGQWLQRGPRSARVSDVVAVDAPAEVHEDFVVR